MAKASNSTGFEDQIDFKSLTGLVRKYKRHVASKPPPEESIWKHKVNFSPRQYKHNSPPRLQNFMCSYRALSPAAEARKKAEERRRFLPSSGSMFRHSVRPKCGQSLGGTELPNASFATVFRIAKPFDVKLQAANESNEHRSLYSDPEIFEFRQVSMVIRPRPGPVSNSLVELLSLTVRGSQVLLQATMELQNDARPSVYPLKDNSSTREAG